VRCDQVDDPGGVPGGAGVADGLVRRAGPAVPGAGALVQGGRDVRLGPGKLAAEHLGEEMVIAEPLPGVVQRHDEEVLPLEHADDLG
jgi:hypothetical protein